MTTDANYLATSRRSIDHLQSIAADKRAVAINSCTDDYESDSLSAFPVSNLSLLVFRRRWAASVIDQPRRPRGKMIILVWATWMLAAVAYLSVVGKQ